MGTQWENFLQNLGEWHGSFAKFSPRGEFLEEVPSHLSLEGFENNKTVRLTLRRFLPDPDGGSQPQVNELVRNYQSFGRDILFFDNGAFSQGSIQLAPFSEFGAEFGFINDRQRLRVVQLYDREGNLANITLIQENQDPETAIERPPLTVESLLGSWQGEAVTFYPDWRSPDAYATSLELELASSNRLIQKLTFGSGSNTRSVQSSAIVNGSILHFEGGSQPTQVLLLPHGASATTPLQAKLRQSFFLEAGWLLEPRVRQRMIRTYNERGEWVSLTLLTERKIEF